MRDHSLVRIRRSADLWYVTAEGHNGLYWHDSQDGAIEEALLWAGMMQPATVVLMENGRKSTIAEYGVAPRETSPIIGGQSVRQSVAGV
jgi:hypothetical protein